VLLVTFGTGIGGGLVLDGRIYRGARGYAGEIGHFTVDREGPMCACGERGHWEAIASGTALGAQARARAGAGGLAVVKALAGGVVDDIRGEHVWAAAEMRARCSTPSPTTSRSGSRRSPTSWTPR
jgi:glucokinase